MQAAEDASIVKLFKLAVKMGRWGKEASGQGGAFCGLRGC
jgi:hypothetical protein